MRVVYLKRAVQDLIWWRQYYERVFPEGKDSAHRQFARTIDLLLSNPYLGHPAGRTNLRPFSIPRMPFTLLYRIENDELRIARVVDQRSSRLREKRKPETETQ